MRDLLADILEIVGAALAFAAFALLLIGFMG